MNFSRCIVDTSYSYYLIGVTKCQILRIDYANFSKALLNNISFILPQISGSDFSRHTAVILYPFTLAYMVCVPLSTPSILTLFSVLSVLSVSGSFRGRRLINIITPIKMRFTVKRINRQNPHSYVVRIKGITIYSKAETDGGGAGRSVG